MGVGVLTTSIARMAIEFGLFLLAVLLLALSRRYKDFAMGQKEMAQEQLSIQAELSTKRATFIESTRLVLDKHYTELELAGGRIQSVAQSRLYSNGLAMIASLRASLTTVLKAVDMQADAPLFAVTAYISKLIKDTEVVASEKGVVVKSEVDQGISTRIQPDEFRQLLSSVLDNALKFSERDGKIEVSAHRHFRKIVIIVKDYGVGISKEKLNELFLPFSRATDTMQYDYEGKGLSLYIDKVILARLGGDMKMTSELGKCTTVTITLPATSRQEALVAPQLITPNIKPQL